MITSNSATAVYLLRNIWAEANYKVGIASVLDRRKWQIEESYGVGPVIVGSAWFPSRQDARQAEKLWHRYLRESRSDDHGGKEWFSLTPEQVKQFVTWLQLSPDEAMLKLKLRAGQLTPAEAKTISTKLIRSIPHAKRVTSGGKP
jgi:hypothetical protein